MHNGNVSIVCDNELKLRLEAKLMAKILLFDIRERTYKTQHENQNRNTTLKT